MGVECCRRIVLDRGAGGFAPCAARRGREPGIGCDGGTLSQPILGYWLRHWRAPGLAGGGCVVAASVADVIFWAFPHTEIYILCAGGDYNMANYTISVHCGCSLSMEHNRRDSSRTAQDGHIDRSRSHSRSDTAQMAWQNRERECLLAICREMGLDMRDVQHNEKRRHLDTAAYKEKQADKTLQDARQRLSAAEDREKAAEAAEAAGKADLAAIRAQTEAARQDLADTLALKERAALIKKPGIFAKKSEVTYHANMIAEIQNIHVKVAQKLRAAETLLASVEAREAAIDRRERETTALHEAAKADRAAAADERERVEDYILSTAETRLKEALHGQPTDREKRLEQFCACIRLKNGINAIDVFNEQERQIEQQSHSWEQSR